MSRKLPSIQRISWLLSRQITPRRQGPLQIVSLASVLPLQANQYNLIGHQQKQLYSSKPGFSNRNKAQQQRQQQQQRAKAAQQTQELSRLGKNRDWEGILNLYQMEKDSFTNVSFTVAISRFARIKHSPSNDPRFQKLMADFNGYIDKRGIEEWLGVREFANIVHAMAKLKRQSPNTLYIVQQVDSHAHWLIHKGTPQAISNVIWACARLGIKPPTLLHELGGHAKRMTRVPQDLSNSVWACATLGMKSPKLFEVLEQQAEWMFEHGTTQEVANSVWACATLDIQSPKLFAELNRKGDWMTKTGLPQEVANSVWACAKLRISSPDLFANLNNNAGRLFWEGKPQEIANIVWSCGTLGVQAPNVFEELDQHAEWMVRYGTPQSIANSLWACAKLGVQSPNLFAALDQNMNVIQFHNDSPHSISISAWACATLGVTSPQFFSKLDENAELLVQNADSQQLANIAWACGTLHVKAPRFFTALDQNHQRLMANGSPQEIGNTLWACAKLRVELSSLFAAADAKAEWFLQNGTAQSIANVLWACAALGSAAPNLYSKLHLIPDVMIETASTQAVANMCHGLAYAMLLSPETVSFPQPTFKKLWDRLLECPADEFTLETFYQAAFVSITANLFDLDLRNIPPDLMKKFDSAEATLTTSSSAKELSQYLSKMGFEHHDEVSPIKQFPGFFSIDLACEERMIAIEFDGPHHFLMNADFVELPRLCGSSKAKNQLLKRLGWKVVRIDWKEWYAEELKDEQKLAWFQRKLHDEGIDWQPKNSQECTS